MSASRSDSRRTLIEVDYPRRRGAIGLRGSGAPLSWEETLRPSSQQGDCSVFELAVGEHDLLEVKLVRNDEDWASGRNYTLHAGDHLRVQPCFDARTSTVLPLEVLEYPGGSLKFEVLLPPSYGEQENKRYPVVYAQDGQALWSRSQDPFGIWSLDTTLDQLFELGAVEEMIVVGIDTSERRIERLSPMADPEHGGGEGPTHLSAIVDALVPSIDGRFRTQAGREHRALLGSSMGGLFAFYGAWTRPDVFGKAICLSSSFWWAQRELIRAVQTGATPSPRPELYVDSGAAASAFEKDPSVRDGYQHSRSMSRALLRHGYSPGNDLHRLTFTGQTHDAAAWAARIAIPMQLLFAPVAATVIPHEVAPAS